MRVMIKIGITKQKIHSKFPTFLPIDLLWLVFRNLIQINFKLGYLDKAFQSIFPLVVESLKCNRQIRNFEKFKGHLFLQERKNGYLSADFVDFPKNLFRINADGLGILV